MKTIYKIPLLIICFLAWGGLFAQEGIEYGENYIVFKHYIKFMHKNPEFEDERPEQEKEEAAAE